MNMEASISQKIGWSCEAVGNANSRYHLARTDEMDVIDENINGLFDLPKRAIIP